MQEYLINLKRTIKSDDLLQQAARALEGLPGRSYACGSYILEALYGRDPGGILIATDSDLTSAARLISEEAGLVRVPLASGCLNLVSRDGGRPITLVSLEGRSIEGHLRQMGFTILAMAIEATGGFPAFLIDPFGGADDISRSCLRATGPESFTDDPLRIVYAAELRQEYGLVPDQQTEKMMRDASGLLPASDGSRTFKTLARLFSRRGLSSKARFLKDVGALGSLFPELEAIYDVPQNYYHHLGVWEHTLLAMDYLEELVGNPGGFFQAYGGRISSHLSVPVESGISRGAFLGIAGLLHDIGKPLCMRVEPSGRIRFKGHHLEGMRLVEDISSRMSLGKRGRRHLASLVRDHMRLGFLIREGESTASRLQVVRELGSRCPDIVILSLVDRMATRGEAASEEALARFKRTASRVLADYFWDLDTPALLGGCDLMVHAGMDAGSEISNMLTRIRVAQREGMIRNRSNALEYVAPDFKGRMDL